MSSQEGETPSKAFLLRRKLLSNSNRLKYISGQDKDLKQNESLETTLQRYNDEKERKDKEREQELINGNNLKYNERTERLFVYTTNNIRMFLSISLAIIFSIYTIFSSSNINIYFITIISIFELISLLLQIIIIPKSFSYITLLIDIVSKVYILLQHVLLFYFCFIISYSIVNIINKLILIERNIT